MVRSEVLTHNHHPGGHMGPLFETTPAEPISPQPLECSFRIISNGNLLESFLCIENSERKRVSDFPKEGVRQAAEHVFRYLARYHEGELWLTPNKAPQFIGDIETKAHLHTDHGWRLCVFSDKKLLHAFHLIAWAHQGRFTGTGGTRHCTVCGKIQYGKTVGHNNMGVINPIYSWPAQVCTDPDCLSHTLDEAVDPAYQAPRDELRTICEAEKNQRNKLVEDVQQAIERAGIARAADRMGLID